MAKQQVLGTIDLVDRKVEEASKAKSGVLAGLGSSPLCLLLFLWAYVIVVLFLWIN